MATCTTCDLCSTVLTRPRDGLRPARLVAMCENPSAVAMGDIDDFELGLDVCKPCLRRAIGMLRDCFGQKCSPEFVEASGKFLVDTQGDDGPGKVEFPTRPIRPDLT